MRKMLVLSTSLCCLGASAQLSDRLKDGLKFYTDSKDSTKFIRLNMTSQIWMRYNQNNPNTLVLGTRQDNTADVSIRRIRLVLSGQLTDRIAFFVQFGQNSFNYLSARKAGSFFHDVNADYAVIKKKLSIGMGLNGWNGPTRFSNISVGSIMALDPPNFQEVTNDSYDQFVRRMGVYAKGKLGKLDYRISAGKPFPIQTSSAGESINKYSTYSTLLPNFVYQGYFMYQFLDQEGNLAPSNAGTYLGKKRVFNVGAGFNTQSKGMYRLGAKGDTIQENIVMYAADVFYDAPLNREKGTAISLYGSYSVYDFGQKYIRIAGPDNPASSSGEKLKTSFNAANYGNAYPYLGSGNIAYMQAGYKFRDSLLGDQGTLQVFADAQYAQYQRLNDPMLVFDTGINWLIRGHGAKITLNYQNRPYFLENSAGEFHETARRNCFVIQYQIAF